ncbi:MAG: DUF3445 domain-containing protein [Thiohalophilus sp.]|jgi:hypothetical protein
MAIINGPVARYFPLDSGQYAIKPGFYRLGHDFGNGRVDNCLIQLDHQFNSYRQSKQSARGEDADKYICLTEEGEAMEPALNRFLLERLTVEYSNLFELQAEPSQHTLLCRATGEALIFDPGFKYLQTHNGQGNTPYSSGLDALACQIQEDLALVQIEEDENRLCAIHLCQPNHWDPRDKIGRDFVGIHDPVPGMAKINARANQLLLACLDQGPYVRFAWGIATDTQLNHHPHPPTGVDSQLWRGRRFDRDKPQAWLRVERQCLWGLPSISAVVFTIRTYHYAIEQLSAKQQRLLYQAVAGMEEEVLAYKGLADSRPDLLEWLQSLYQDHEEAG